MNRYGVIADSAYEAHLPMASYTRSVSVTGLILFAHGARDPRWAEPFERLKRKVEAARPELPVALAYLEIMQPDLRHRRRVAGCMPVAVAARRPVFLGQGGHVREDLPAIVARGRARHPTVVIACAPRSARTTRCSTRLAKWRSRDSRTSRAIRRSRPRAGGASRGTLASNVRSFRCQAPNAHRHASRSRTSLAR